MSEIYKPKTNTFKSKFAVGDMVFHLLNPEEPGLITGILFRPTGVTYLVTWKNNNLEEKDHYEMEITNEKSFSV